MTSSSLPSLPSVKSIPHLAVAGTWEAARHWIHGAATAEKLKVFCQVMCGFELKALKKAHGVFNGANQHQGRVSHDGKPTSESESVEESWQRILGRETGLSPSSAYRFEDMAAAALPRLRKIPALKDFDPSAQSISALPAPTVEALSKAVHKLTDGQTQKEFGESLGLWKTPGAGAGRKPGDGGRRKLSLSEQAEARKELATAHWQSAEHALYSEPAGFVLLSDMDIEIQIGRLDRASAARKAWLKQPLNRRDAKAIEAMFRES
jgi:hypothetical protein